MLYVDRQDISYTTNVQHPNLDPDQPGAHSTIDVTFGNQQQQPQESHVTNVFNKDYYIPPKTIENYQKPLQYQSGVVVAKQPADSQLFNVGYTVNFADAKKNLLKKTVRGQDGGEIITGTRKAQEIVEKPNNDYYQFQQNSPSLVEIIKSEEVNVNSQHQRTPLQFDHANALGRSVGFDHSNAMEGRSPVIEGRGPIIDGRSPIYKKYVRPGSSLEQKAEHYFKSPKPVRIVHLQAAAASGAVPTYERVVGQGQGRYGKCIGRN